MGEEDPGLVADHLGANPHSTARNRVTPDNREPLHVDFLAGQSGLRSWGPPALWSPCTPAFAQKPACLGRVQRTGPSLRRRQQWWPISVIQGWTPSGNTKGPLETTSADPRGQCCGYRSQQRGITVGTWTITAKVYSASAGGRRCPSAFCVLSPVLLVTAYPVVVSLSSFCIEETEAQTCLRLSIQSHSW